MDSIKQQLALDLRNFAVSLADTGVAGHPEATVEYIGEENLAAYLRVTHPSIQGHRQFELRLKETI